MSNNSDTSDTQDSSKKKTTEFYEKMVKFIKYDDLIKTKMDEHRKCINNLKTEKKNAELWLLNSIEKMKNKDGEPVDTISYSGGELKKIEIQKKTSINKDVIKKSIMDNLVIHKLVDNEMSGQTILENILNSIENNRNVTKEITLKKIVEKPKKTKKQK